MAGNPATTSQKSPGPRPARQIAAIAFGHSPVHQVRPERPALRPAARFLDVLVADPDLLGRIRQVRALQAARDILSHYQSETFGSAKPSEPLRWTDAKLKKLESAPGGAAQVLRQRLVTLTKRHPAWSEAWLELGYLQLEEGDEPKALQSFTRATAGHRLSDLELSNRNPQLDAHAARGRLLAARGALDEAKHSFPHALAYKYTDGMVNIDLGHLLWSRGEGRKAARYFFYGMVYDPVTWTLPKCPRNAQTLDFEALTSK